MQSGLFPRPYVVPERLLQGDDGDGTVNLEQLIKELGEVAKRLPVTSSCTVAVGAVELHAFTTILHSCIELCDVYLEEMDKRSEDKRLGRKHAPPEPYLDHQGRIAEPWKTHNHVTWLERHRQLWQMMVRCRDQLQHEQATYEAPEERTKKQKEIEEAAAAAANNKNAVKKPPKVFQRLIDLCYILNANILQCCYCVATDSMLRSYKAYMPPPAIADAGLLLGRTSSTEPVQIDQMVNSVLFDHLYHLMSSWNELRYSEELRNYVLLLELRASFLITCAHSSLECDAPAHQLEHDKRREGELEADALIRERFSLNLGAVGVLMCVFMGFYERLYFVLKFGSATDSSILPFPYNLGLSVGEQMPDTDAIDERRTRFDRVHKWILQGAMGEQSVIPSGFLQRSYPEASLWPNERLLYQLDRKRENAGVSHTAVALTVMKKFRAVDSTDVVVHPLLRAKRGMHYSTIVENATTPTATLIKEGLVQVTAADAAGKESTLLRLALHEFVSNQVNRLLPNLKWDTYVVMWENVPLQYKKIATALMVAKEGDDSSFLFGEGDSMDGITPKSRYSVYPYMVQVFNHWNVLYGGKIYWVDSYIDALAMWLCIIEKHHNRHVEKLDISPLLDAIFDNQREQREMQQRLKRAGSRGAFAVGTFS